MPPYWRERVDRQRILPGGGGCRDRVGSERQLTQSEDFLGLAHAAQVIVPKRYEAIVTILERRGEFRGYE